MMNSADEIDLLMQQLTNVWGSVAIACEEGTCAVSDGVERVYEAPTLLEALRKAADALGVVT